MAVKVLDPEGLPVQGALVISVPTTEQPERLYPRIGPGVTRTDEDGLARFLLPTSEATTIVSATGFAVRLATTETRRTVLRLKRGAGTTFRVRDARGEGAPSVVIHARGLFEAPLALTDEEVKRRLTSRRSCEPALRSRTPTEPMPRSSHEGPPRTKDGLLKFT